MLLCILGKFINTNKMHNKLKLAVIAICYAPAVFAQTDATATQPTTISESAFTLTEAQLGEDEDMS